MKKSAVIISILMAISFSNGFSQNRSIAFIEKPFSELLSQAKTQKKLIFMDAYTTWCGPCKWISANIFTNDSVADYFNKNFICTKFDMEKGEGTELGSRYQVRAYPTLLFIDGDGNMVHKRVGAPRQLKEYLDMGKVALTPGQGLAALSKRYNEGVTDPAEMMIYLKRLQEAYMPVNVPLAKYMATQKDEELTSTSNWNLIYAYSDDMNSREFVYLVKNQDKFAAVHTPDSVEQKISEVYLKALITQTRSRQFKEEEYNKTKLIIRESGYSGAEKVIFTADINMYLGQGQAEKFFEEVYTGTDKYYSGDYKMLNSLAWQVFTMTDDEKYLKKAADWAKRSVELKNQSAGNDTYAQILFKLGRKDEAIHHEKMAIELAKKEGAETKEFEQTLLKMQE